MIVSIITVVLNNETHLEQTIQSVIGQSYESIEYIVIDGKSIDGTVDIIKNYENSIDYWISEEDDGIYHAMNKGILKASGDIIGLINSDDWLEFDAVENVVKHIGDNDLFIGAANKLIKGEKRHWYTENFGSLNWAMLFPHCSMFVKSHVYHEIGIFDQGFRISADYLFLRKCVAKGIKIKCHNVVLANFRCQGISNWPESKLIVRRESKMIRNMFIQTFPYKRGILTHLKILRYTIVSTIKISLYNLIK